MSTEKHTLSCVLRESSNLEDAIRTILSFRSIDESEVAEALLVLSLNPEDWMRRISVLKNEIVTINWIKVFESMDTPSCTITPEMFKRLLDFWRHINGENTFPFRYFLHSWANRQSLENILGFIVEDETSGARTCTLCANVFITRVIKEAEGSKLDLKSNFNCLELFEVVKELQLVQIVRKILRYNRDWGVVGLVLTHPMCAELLDEYMETIIHEQEPILEVLFQLDKELVVSCLDRSNILLDKATDICIEMRIIPYLAETLSPPYFSFDVLFLCCRRECINVQIFISNCVNSKKEAGVFNMISYMIEKFKEKPGNYEEEFYPLTHEIIFHALKKLEQHVKSFSRDTNALFLKLKNNLPVEIKALVERTNNYETEANEFISSVMRGQRSVTEALTILEKYKKGNIKEREVAMKIFYTLVENYRSFVAIPNKEISLLYGKILDHQLFPSAHTKKILNNLSIGIKKEECPFALQTIECFIDNLKKYPKFLKDIEEVVAIKEHIRNKRTIYILEEAILPTVGKDEIIPTLNYMGGSAEIRAYWDGLKQGRPQKAKNIHPLEVLNFIFEEKIFEESTEVISFVKNFHLEKKFLERTFQVLKHLLNCRIEDEKKYCYNLGILVGRLTVEKNDMFTLDEFDMYKFILSGIERKRVHFFVHFLCAFLSVGMRGIIFRRGNPYVDFFLEILTEVNIFLSCSEIKNLFSMHKISLECETTHVLLSLRDSSSLDSTKINTLAPYEISLEGVEMGQIKSYIVGMAIDFSVREVSYIIEQKAINVAERSAKRLLELKGIKAAIEKEKPNDDVNKKIEQLAESIEVLSTKKSSGRSKFKEQSRKKNLSITELHVKSPDESILLKRLTINTLKSLVYVSAQEPLRESIYGNISHFLKLANLSLNNDMIKNITESNITTCCDLLLRHALTKIGQTVEAEGHKVPTKKISVPTFGLSLLKNTKDYFPLVFEPVKLSEYNEIKEKLLDISRKNPRKCVLEGNRLWRELLASDLSVSSIDNMISCISKSSNSETLSEVICSNLITHILHKRRASLFYLLQELFKISPRSKKAVTSWIIYSKDERRHNIPLVIEFLKFKLIPIFELDVQMSKMIFEEADLNFTVRFLERALKEVTSPYDHIYTIEALYRLNEDKFDVRVYNFLGFVTGILMDGEQYKIFEDFLEVLDEESQFPSYSSTLSSNGFSTKNPQASFSAKTPSSPKNITLSNNEKKAVKILEGVSLNEFTESSFSACWNHFLKYSMYPSLSASHRLEVLAEILAHRKHLPTGLNVLASLFYVSLEKRNHLYQKIVFIFLRKILSVYEEIYKLRPVGSKRILIITNLLKNVNGELSVDENPFYSLNTVKQIFFNFLATISPQIVPSFANNFIQLCDTPLIYSLPSKNLFSLALKILYPLKYFEESHNQLLEFIETFISHLPLEFIARYGLALTPHIPRKFPSLKNLLFLNKITLSFDPKDLKDILDENDLKYSALYKIHKSIQETGSFPKDLDIKDSLKEQIITDAICMNNIKDREQINQVLPEMIRRVRGRYSNERCKEEIKICINEIENKKIYNYIVEIRKLVE